MKVKSKSFIFNINSGCGGKIWDFKIFSKRLFLILVKLFKDQGHELFLISKLLLLEGRYNFFKTWSMQTFKIDHIFKRLRPFLRSRAFLWSWWHFWRSYYLSINFTLFKFAVPFDHDFWFFRRPSFFINFALFYFCHFWSITLLLKKAQNQDFPEVNFLLFCTPFLSKSGFTVKDEDQG